MLETVSSREIMKLCILQAETKYELNHWLTTDREGELVKVWNVEDQ